MMTKPEQNRDDNRRTAKRRLAMAALAALPAIGFAAIGGAWFTLVAWDRLFYTGPRSLLLRGFDTLVEPSLILSGGLASAACGLLLARAGMGRGPRLALAAIAILPSLLVGGYAATWIVRRLFVLSIVIWPSDMAMAVGGLLLAILSVSAVAWLLVHRR